MIKNILPTAQLTCSQMQALVSRRMRFTDNDSRIRQAISAIHERNTIFYSMLDKAKDGDMQAAESALGLVGALSGGRDDHLRRELLMCLPAKMFRSKGLDAIDSRIPQLFRKADVERLLKSKTLSGDESKNLAQYVQFIQDKKLEEGWEKAKEKAGNGQEAPQPKLSFEAVCAAAKMQADTLFTNQNLFGNKSTCPAVPHELSAAQITALVDARFKKGKLPFKREALHPTIRNPENWKLADFNPAQTHAMTYLTTAQYIEALNFSRSASGPNPYLSQEQIPKIGFGTLTAIAQSESALNNLATHFKNDLTLDQITFLSGVGVSVRPETTNEAHQMRMQLEQAIVTANQKIGLKGLDAETGKDKDLVPGTKLKAALKRVNTKHDTDSIDKLVALAEERLVTLEAEKERRSDRNQNTGKVDAKITEAKAVCEAVKNIKKIYVKISDAAAILLPPKAAKKVRENKFVAGVLLAERKRQRPEAAADHPAHDKLSNQLASQLGELFCVVDEHDAEWSEAIRGWADEAATQAGIAAAFPDPPANPPVLPTVNDVDQLVRAGLLHDDSMALLIGKIAQHPQAESQVFVAQRNRLVALQRVQELIDAANPNGQPPASVDFSVINAQTALFSSDSCFLQISQVQTLVEQAFRLVAAGENPASNHARKFLSKLDPAKLSYAQKEAVVRNGHALPAPSPFTNAQSKIFERVVTFLAIESATPSNVLSQGDAENFVQNLRKALHNKELSVAKAKLISERFDTLTGNHAPPLDAADRDSLLNMLAFQALSPKELFDLNEGAALIAGVTQDQYQAHCKNDDYSKEQLLFMVRYTDKAKLPAKLGENASAHVRPALIEKGHADAFSPEWVNQAGADEVARMLQASGGKPSQSLKERDEFFQAVEAQDAAGIDKYVRSHPEGYNQLTEDAMRVISEDGNRGNYTAKLTSEESQRRFISMICTP